MTGKAFIFLILVNGGSVFSLGIALDDILRSQVLAWCDIRSATLVYSKGMYFRCKNDSIITKYYKDLDNIKDYTLKIGVFQGHHDYVYDCQGTSKNGELESNESYTQFIINLLQDILQFKIAFVPSTSWGHLEKSSNTWTGLRGLIANKTVDLALCHWALTDNAASVADFLFSTLETTESFVYLPENLPLSHDVFLDTFSKKLWFFFVLSIFLLVVSFRFSTSMHSSVRPDHDSWSWDEVMLWSVAAISQQSYSRHPRGSSCRTMFLIGYTITYLLYTGFAAGVTSLLALKGHQNQLTFDDVTRLNLKLLFHDSEFYFDPTQLSPDAKSTYAYHLERNERTNLSEIFSKINRKNYVGFGATVTFVNYLRTRIDTKKRGSFLVFTIPNSIRQKAILIQKTFKFRKILNYWLLRLMESGLLDLGRKRYLKLEDAAKYKTAKWLSADLRNVLSAVFFIVGGWILSILILVMEILWFGRNRMLILKEKKQFHSGKT